MANHTAITSQNGFHIVGFYDSGHSSERYSQLVLGSRYPVFVIPEGDWPTCLPVETGDVLVVQAEGQVTTERDTNTEVISSLELWLSDGRKLEISEENGENVDMDRHHHKLTGAGMIEIPPVDPGATAKVVWMWGAFNGSTQPNYVQVGNTASNWKDYGRLLFQHYRPI